MREPKPKPLAHLVEQEGGRFSTELGIKLDSGESGEIFKWLLAAILYGARISESVATRTYEEFVKEGLVTPEKIVRRGWDGLVKVLDSGGYVRYDFKTATKLLEVCRTLIKRYGGDLSTLHQQAHSPEELETMLHELGKGLGEVTIGIFLRELREVWRRAHPVPSDLVLAGAKDLGLLPRDLESREEALAALRESWRSEGGRPSRFPDFEAALLRRGLKLRRAARKGRRPQIPLRTTRRTQANIPQLLSRSSRS